MKNNKVEQLVALRSLMGEAERKYCEKQNAMVDFWANGDAMIMIDAGAIDALIDYYKAKEA